MNRFQILSALALLVLVIALPIYAVQEQSRLSVAQDHLQAQSIVNGSVLYLRYCAECHGSNGEGNDLNPALNRLGLAEADPNVLFKIISRAAHGTSMASWHLEEGGVFNDFQIRELVTMIRFADWSIVQQMALDKGLNLQGIATRDIAEISASMLSEEDPHQCIACHEDPKVHRGQFGLDCVRCHTLEAWIPASLTRHTFALDHGDQGDVACETCHIKTYAVNTCYECHDHKAAQMAELHTAEGIDDYDACQICHPTGAPEEGRAIWKEILDGVNASEFIAARRISQ